MTTNVFVYTHSEKENAVHMMLGQHLINHHYAANNGYAIVRTYLDICQYDVPNRPGFEMLLRDAKSQNVDTVLVSCKEILKSPGQSLVARLESCGLKLVYACRPRVVREWPMTIGGSVVMVSIPIGMEGEEAMGGSDEKA